MTFKDFIGGGNLGLIGVINVIIVPVLFGLAFVSFIWGILRYFFLRPTSTASFGERGGYAEGRQFILWGILGMVMMLAVWGFIRILLSTLGLA